MKIATLCRKYASYDFTKSLLHNKAKRAKELKIIRACLEECQEDKDQTKDEIWAKGYLSGIGFVLSLQDVAI